MKQDKSSITDEQSLQFFGKINASISHELKNILAIISETMGFIDDLVALTRQGNTFDFDILENSSKSIAEEIERGFHTIRQMNKLAHSVDDPVREIDLVETLQLANKLTGFLSYARPVKITPPAENIFIETNPFLLLCVFYQSLLELYKFDEKSDLTIHVTKSSEQKAGIMISGFSNDNLEFSPTPELDKIGQTLKATWQSAFKPFKIILNIPTTTGL